MYENEEEIDMAIAEILGKRERKGNTSSLVYKRYGKKFSELSEEEKKEYYKWRYNENRTEEMLAHKREYMRERYNKMKVEGGEAK